jgi:hypothetical protein
LKKIKILSPDNSIEFELDLKPTESFKDSDFLDYLFFIDKVGKQFKIITTIFKGDDFKEFIGKYQFYASGKFDVDNSKYINEHIYTSILPIALIEI